MVKKPSTADEAIAYVWDVTDTVIGPADKQSLAAALAEKTDADARRYFYAPSPELWVGTLRELLKPTGTFSWTLVMTCTAPLLCLDRLLWISASRLNQQQHNLLDAPCQHLVAQRHA